jgi:Sortase domain
VDVPVTGTDLDHQVPVAVPPVRIRIPAIGVDMGVQPEGLAEGGAMALPPNPADAAWYRYGSWPGSAEGATVIAAHVDSLEYSLGPLARLPEATAGTEVFVTGADGQEHRYLVQDGGMTRKPEVNWDAVFDRSGPARLTIVTCGGEFDYNRRTYLDNVVVNAVPAP